MVCIFSNYILPPLTLLLFVSRLPSHARHRWQHFCHRWLHSYVIRSNCTSSLSTRSLPRSPLQTNGTQRQPTSETEPTSREGSPDWSWWWEEEIGGGDRRCDEAVREAYIEAFPLFAPGVVSVSVFLGGVNSSGNMLIKKFYRYIGSDKAIADLPFMNGNVSFFFFGYRHSLSSYSPKKNIPILSQLPSLQVEVLLRIFFGGVPT